MENKNEVTAAEDSSQPPPPKKQNRRGRGSKSKAAEKFRTHKNETKGMDYINSRIAKFTLVNALPAEELFGPMCVSIPKTKPPQSIAISTHKLGEIARQTVETLVHACKVPTPSIEHDIETVQLASSLQLSAKIRLAQRNTPFQTVNLEEDTLTENTVRNASQSILPIATFLDQVGQVEVDGQMFVPVEQPADDGLLYSYSYTKFGDASLARRDEIAFLKEGAFDIHGNPVEGFQDLIPLDRIGFNGGRMFMSIRDRARALEQGIIDEANNLNPQLAVPPPHDILVLHELNVGRSLPPPSEVYRRYIDFLARVQKKVAFEKLPSLMLERARGTQAQLAFAGEWIGDFRDVHCAREITSDALFIGSAFELNIIQQPLTDPLACVIRGTVNTRNAIPRLMQCLSQRVERK